MTKNLDNKCLSCRDGLHNRCHQEGCSCTKCLIRNMNLNGMTICRVCKKPKVCIVYRSGFRTVSICDECIGTRLDKKIVQEIRPITGN